VDAAVGQALARDPQDRYPSAGLFARALLAATQRGDATGVLAPPPPRPLARGRTWRVDTTVALLAIILVLVATLAVFAAFQGRTAAPPAATPGPGRSAAPAAAVTPNVVGKSVADATAALIAVGYGLVGYDVDNTARGTPCTVARQQPAASSAVTRGATAMIWYVPGNNCTKSAKGNGG
jgi:hypothetical protein